MLLYFLILVLASLCFAFNAVLNIDELNLIHYKIEIVKDPVLKDQEWDAEIVTMTNKFGQEYICSMPKVQFSESEPKKEEELLEQLVDITDLLKPMEQAPCLMKKKDWWTYEFCYGSSIKQYHSEDDKVSSATVILGKYESEYNWKNSTETKNKLQKFHSQFYVNGTKCDITGESRRAEVRFHCEEGAGDYIQRVDEPESCRYIVVIATTKLCHHPYLRSHPNRVAHGITCAPALSKDQFEKYQEVQRVKLSRKDTSLVDGDESSTSNISELDEDDKLSIRFFTIPVGGKNSAKMALKEKGILIAEDPPEQTHKEILKEMAFEAKRYTKSLSEKVVSALNEKYDKVQSYMSEKDEQLDKDARKTALPSKEGESAMDEKIKDAKVDQTESTKENEDKSDDDIEIARARLTKLLDKWKLIHEKKNNNENLENIQELYEKFEFLQETGTALLDNSLALLVSDLETLGEKIRTAKAQQTDAEESGSTGEEALTEKLKRLSKEFKETEAEVAKAKDKIGLVSNYLRSKLDDDLKDVLDLEKDQKRWSQLDNDDSNENQFETFNKEAEKGDSEGVNKNGNSLDSPIKKADLERRAKLEQGIRDRLQKQGLANIGRKIEVKLLTPSYGEDDDGENALSSLSNEESDAFQDMIVNILSANAEELQERERHKNLEINYKFEMDENNAEGSDENNSEDVEDSVQNPLQDPVSENIFEDL